MSEEQQGSNLVQAAAKAGVQCFLWSSLPSSAEISKGKFVTRLYEGKRHTIYHIAFTLSQVDWRHVKKCILLAHD